MRQRTAWLKIGALLVLALGIYETVSWLNLEEWLHPDRLADWLREAGAVGPLLFMLLMAAAVVVSPIPSLPLIWRPARLLAFRLGPPTPSSARRSVRS